MNYLKRYLKYICLIVFICLAFNLYYIFLVDNRQIDLLVYLDFLLVIVILIFAFFEYLGYRKTKRKKDELLKLNTLIFNEFDDVDAAIIEHDINYLKNELQNQYDINSNLQDYFARWCHEIKIPLSSLVLMNEKILDNDLKQAMKYPLEKIKQQLNYVMLGCKVQSHLYDLKVTKINILDCIKSSIRNNRFFLIEKKFDIKIDIDETFVYSDKEWLTYIIDQLINNAIKYSKKDPYLKIWTKKDKNETLLFFEDNGEGIKKEDLPRIFERGYIGSNHRNNQYKSTGFGLYMVDLILKRLGHDCYVESSFSKYTCFIIVFKDNRDFFNL